MFGTHKPNSPARCIQYEQPLLASVAKAVAKYRDQVRHKVGSSRINTPRHPCLPDPLTKESNDRNRVDGNNSSSCCVNGDRIRHLACLGRHYRSGSARCLSLAGLTMWIFLYKGMHVAHLFTGAGIGETKNHSWTYRVTLVISAAITAFCLYLVFGFGTMGRVGLVAVILLIFFKFNKSLKGIKRPAAW